MTEVDQILYSLGYYDSDPQKQSIVQGYIDEATEFMRESGVFALGAEEYQEDAAKKAEELFQLTQQVTTARFCGYENSLVRRAVFMTDGSQSVEERLEDLKNELRFYFDE